MSKSKIKSMKSKVRIVHLLEVPEFTGTLINWYVEEWEPWYGSGGDGDAESDLRACCSKEALPICLVAIDSTNELLGTVALRPISVGSELGVGPWLSAFLVGETYRGHGVGTSLIKAIEEEARRLNIVEIFTSTNSACQMFKRRGWEAYGSSKSLRGDVTVFRWETSTEI
ncbi:MAG: GNAT family N-acetyltransferase [Rhodospirillales bacterium]|nr:GNAT family N-acetyltransferase [Rhodospirillales bacterium]